MYSLPQKLIAEFIGTFAFVFIGAGAICADQYLTSTGQNGWACSESPWLTG